MAKHQLEITLHYSSDPGHEFAEARVPYDWLWNASNDNYVMGNYPVTGNPDEALNAALNSLLAQMGKGLRPRVAE